MGIYLYGCSGHGKVVLDILTQQGLEVSAFADDNPPVDTEYIHGIPIFPASKALALVKPEKNHWIVTIGNNNVRKKVVSTLLKEGHQFATAIHPAAQIAMGVKILPGSIVMANAVINTDTQVGQHAIINTGATIDHDCVIGDFAHIAPGSSLCGQVFIGQGALLGVGCKVIPCQEIGEWATCGAGSIIVNSIPSHSLAYGCPAKVVKSKY